MFLVAWSQKEAEAGRTHSQRNIAEIAPGTTDEARFHAAAYIGSFETANGMSIEAIYAQACTADKIEHSEVIEVYRNDQCEEKPEVARHPEEFGHSLGMMALGTGVTWWDDHERFQLNDGMKLKNLNFPMTEFYLEPELPRHLPALPTPRPNSQEPTR